MTSTAFVRSAEAAYIAELTDRDMNRVFDERLVPDALICCEDGRRFARLASAFANFYFVTDRIYAGALRRRVVAELTERVAALHNKDHVLALQNASSTVDWMVRVSFGQVVDVSTFVESAARRAQQVDAAKEVIEVPEDVMSASPVFAGTRVPIDIVMASLQRGLSMERIVASYPFLTPSLVDAAKIYQLVHPKRGRPRRLGEMNPDWPVTEGRVARPALCQPAP